MARTITINVSEADWKALSWKHVDPAQYLNDFIDERIITAINDIANEEIKRRLNDPNWNAPVPADKIQIISELELPRARDVNEEVAQKMRQMVEDPNNAPDFSPAGRPKTPEDVVSNWQPPFPGAPLPPEVD